ncbi:MAG: tape measure protein, partial [Acidimicrobiia bacterium]
MADRTVTVRFNADDKSLKDAQDRLEEGNRRLGKTFKEVGLEQKGNASEQKKLRAAVERTYKSQDTMNRFIIRYRRELEELTRQQKAEIAVMQKKGAAVEELTASTAKYERLREQARTRNAQDMVQAQRQETRRRSGGRGGATGDDGAGSWFKTANREGVSLLGTLNDISFKLFVVTFAAKQAADTLLRAFVVVGEELQMIRFRMDQFSDSTQAFDQIYGIAQKLGVSMKDLSNTFLRFAVVNESVGLTTQQMVDLTGVVAKLGVVGGGSVQEINAGMQQLAQGFASNRLQGDELRSVMENLPFLAVTLSRELDTTISGLREMGSAGLLTAETVAEALLSAGKEVERIMENLPQVTEKSLQRIENAWANIIDTALSTTGTEGLAGALNDFAKALDTVAGTIESNSVPVAAFINSLDEIGETLLYVFGARYGMSLVLAGMDSYRSGVEKAEKANKAFSKSAWIMRGVISGPFITVLAAAAWGVTTWRSEMEKTREEVKKLADDVDGFVESLNGMTRAQLNRSISTARAGIELSIGEVSDRIREMQELQERAAASRAPATGVGGFVETLTSPLGRG